MRFIEFLRIAITVEPRNNGPKSNENSHNSGFCLSFLTFLLYTGNFGYKKKYACSLQIRYFENLLWKIDTMQKVVAPVSMDVLDGLSLTDIPGFDLVLK